MAIFTETKTPYEFLVRWNNEGSIQGAHIGFLNTVKKDDEIINQTATNVESVAIGINEGFPLSDILDQTLIDALLLIETLQASKLVLESEKTNLTSIKTNLETYGSDLQNQIESLIAASIPVEQIIE